MRLQAITSLLIATGSAGLGHAAVVTPPTGCQAFLTVQIASCEVEHYWRCESDPEDVKWRYVLGEDGPSYTSQVDNEYRWIYSESLINGRQRFMGKPEKDLQSFATLMRDGTDSFDFVQIVNIPGQAPFEQHITGFDQLNGEAVTIDGEALIGSIYEMREETEGGDLYEQRGQEYILEEFNLFLGGRGEYRNNKEAWQSYNAAPVTFSRPGEAGFLTSTPLFGCGDTLSALDAPVPPAG